jgi:hypothetical protein
LRFAKEAGATSNGVFNLTQPNTYTGNTIVANGATLLVNNPLAGGGSGTGTGGVTAQGRVGGTGRIGGSFINANVGLSFGGTGVVAPGDPTVDGGIGRLTVTRSIQWVANGTLEVQLAGTTDTDAHRDQLRTDGILGLDTANANVRLVVQKVGNFEFTPGQTYSYRIAQANDGVGGFAPSRVTIVPSFGTASEFTISYEDGPGVENYLVLNYTPVPEPGAVLGVCAAAAGLAGVIRRFRRAGPGSAAGGGRGAG